MKIFPPARGPVLFTLPAISFIGRYAWISKTPAQRRKETVLWCLIAFLLFVGANTSSITRYSSIEWAALTVIIAAIGSMIYWSQRLGAFFPAHSRNHFFFENSAHVYTGRSRRGYSLIIPDRVACIGVQEASFEGTRFHLYTVEFKDTIPGWLPNYEKTQFGIPALVDLTPFTEWMSRNGLTLAHQAQVGTA